MSSWTIVLIIGYFSAIALNLIFSCSMVTVLNLLLCMAIIMVPAAVILLVGKLLPKKYFRETKHHFKVGKFKKSVCNLTKVKRWKDKVPVAGKVLNKISAPKDESFLSLFIFESCFAEWLHLAICYWSVIGCIIIFLVDKSLFLPIALPIALIFIYQNMSSVIIQWFMRPRMVRYRELLTERRLRQHDEENVSESKCLE